MRGRALCLVVCLAAFLPTLSGQEISDAVLELLPLPGAYQALATGVNDRGDVVGVSHFLDEFGFGRLRATLWPASGGPPIALTEFPGSNLSEAKAINAAGDVVGIIRTDGLGHNAVIWRGGGAPEVLVGLGGDKVNRAVAINDAYIVGASKNFPRNRDRATRWPIGGGTPAVLHSNDLGTSASFANGVNNSGVAAGHVRIGGIFDHPVIFTGATAPLLSLSSLGGDWGGSSGIAYGINDAGDVVGYSYVPLTLGAEFFHRRPTLWPASTRVPRDLGSVTAFPGGQAFSISERGDIVGESGGLFDAGAFARATLWPANGGQPRDLGGPPEFITTARSISPSSSYAAGYMAIPHGPRTAVRFRITLPNADSDGDGIANNVDVEPAVFSHGFRDVALGGTTSGSVLARGNQVLSIVDDPAPGGLRITASSTGGSDAATIEVCGGGAIFTMTAGDDFLVTCGSVIASVLAGSIDVRLIAAGDRIATTSVDAGNGFTFDPSTFIVTAAVSNTAAIVITVSNNPFTLNPGQVVQLVPDETPPSLAVENVTVNATAPDGAIVSYSVTATDDFDPNPVVACAPPSANLFPIGSTVVSCTATDRAGLSSSKSFAVMVLGAPEQIAGLIELLKSKTLPPSLETRLIVTLQQVLNAPNGHVACVALRRFVDALQSTPATQLPAEMAAALIADAERIGAVLSCP